MYRHFRDTTLAELLLKKGYIVHGIKRRSSLFNTDRIDHLYQDPHIDNQRFILHYGDLTDSTNLIRIIQQVQSGQETNLPFHPQSIQNRRLNRLHSPSFRLIPGLELTVFHELCGPPPERLGRE